MGISNEIINTTEDKIKSYYRNQSEIECLKHRIELLNRHRKEIEDDINNSNIALNCNVKGIDYSKDRVHTSVISSIQETEIELAFERLERQLVSIDREILDIKTLIRELERKMSDIEFLFNKLHNEAKDFVRLRYKEKKSFRCISNALHISEATVWRYREMVLGDLSKWICAFY